MIKDSVAECTAAWGDVPRDFNISSQKLHTAVSGLTRSTPTITRLCHIYCPGNCHSITRPARCASEREIRQLADITNLFPRGVQPTSHQSSNTPRWAPVGMGTSQSEYLSPTMLDKWANATLN